MYREWRMFDGYLVSLNNIRKMNKSDGTSKVVFECRSLLSEGTFYTLV